jgi:hypothetical protein
MILQCGDLERALRTPELMPDMRSHAEECAGCAAQLHLWSEISRLAPGLHEEWESPYLWQRIAANLAGEAPRPKPAVWRWALAAAGMLALALMLLQPWRGSTLMRSKAPSRELLTDNALQEVQQAEQAYTRSIDRLAAIAAQELERSSSPLAAAYREKLTVLDSAIAELKTNVETNRYNTYLRTELASLYQQKQKTLQEWLQNANRN